MDVYYPTRYEIKTLYFNRMTRNIFARLDLEPLIDLVDSYYNVSNYKEIYFETMNNTNPIHKREYQSYFIKQLLRAYVIYLHKPTRYNNDLKTFLRYIVVDNNKVLYRKYMLSLHHGKINKVRVGLDRSNSKVVSSIVDSVIVLGYDVVQEVLVRYINHHSKHDTLDLL